MIACEHCQGAGEIEYCATCNHELDDCDDCDCDVENIETHLCEECGGDGEVEPPEADD